MNDNDHYDGDEDDADDGDDDTEDDDDDDYDVDDDDIDESSASEPMSAADDRLQCLDTAECVRVEACAKQGRHPPIRRNNALRGMRIISFVV